MDKERLVEAINAHDPDGKGLERVLKALVKTDDKGYNNLALNRLSGTTCLLARAWDCRANQVEATSFANGTRFEHLYRDVVRWFDKEDRIEELKEMFKDEIQASH